MTTLRVLIEDELDRLSPAGPRLVAHPGSGPSFRSALAPLNRERVLVAIGPEGGWNGFELALLGRHGFVEAGFGSRTLATTTACIAALSLVHEILESGSTPYASATAGSGEA